MKIETITVGAFEVNCYILHGTGNRVLIADPGDEAERILDILAAQNLSVSAYLLTHGHADHLSALAPLVQRFPAPVCMHPSDAAWAFSARNQIPPFYTVPQAPSASIRDLRNGSTWDDAGLQYTVLETPGHTPGGVCFYFSPSRTLITGDTLFAGSVGRTDLPGGDAAMLQISLARLKVFTDEVRVYPGHGPATTIGQEKKTNVFMQ
jgi:hydroxyacylglutathione hydrolase